MQKLRYLLFLMLLASSASAQFKVLFIDDSGDTFGNAEFLASTLDSLGYDYDYVDAIGQNYTPTATDMSGYDLVIWHTSSWGAGLQFWNGTDVLNPELAQYLSQPDANLWLIGLDYFYDRYGAAPSTFQAGDFEYDFLGISKYAVQSYADDGNLGVPFVAPAPGQPIPGLGNIDWQFSTLWYADGFELRPEATPVYLFGGAGYLLNGTPTGVWYHPTGGARVLSYGFDLSLASDFNLMRTHVGTVLDWWQNELSATKSSAQDLASVTVSPNVFTDQVDIRVKTLVSTPISIQIHDAAGHLIARVSEYEMLPAAEEKIVHWDAPKGLPAGFYYCTVRAGQQQRTTKLVKQR